MDGCEREELDSVVMGSVSLSSQANWIAFKCFFFVLPLCWMVSMCGLNLLYLVYLEFSMCNVCSHV